MHRLGLLGLLLMYSPLWTLGSPVNGSEVVLALASYKHVFGHAMLCVNQTFSSSLRLHS